MKRLLLLLLSVLTAVSLCACGDKDSRPGPHTPQQSGPADVLPLRPCEEGEAPETPEESAQPAPPPPVDAEADYYRGTWISVPEENVSDTLDHYMGSAPNSITLSEGGRGALALGGVYREISWRTEGDSMILTCADTGEQSTLTRITDIISELDYLDSGQLMTFILIEDRE